MKAQCSRVSNRDTTKDVYIKHPPKEGFSMCPASNRRRSKHSCFATGFVKASSQIRKELIEFVKSQTHGNQTSYLSGIRKALSLHAASGGNKAEPSQLKDISDLLEDLTSKNQGINVNIDLESSRNTL
ncbi:hypothetical protein LSAT2_025926 [Lamellibrachia satsuma]|nr:hypothetical protein LSAT2_025926 [Lamellibrachia satsuma]